MSTRQLAQRQYTNVGVEAPGKGIQMAQAASVALQTTQKFMEKRDEAKMNDFAADAQIQMLQATNKWRAENADNPTDKKALYALDAEYDKITQQFKDKLSPFGRDTWHVASQELKGQMKMKNVEWGMKQEVVNAESRVNTSIKKYESLAYSLGETGDIKTAQQAYENARKGLEVFSNGVLTSEKYQELTEDFKSGFMKSFIEGKSNVDPQGALDLLANKEVKEAIGSKEHYDILEKLSNRQLKDIERREKIQRKENGKKITAELIEDSNSYSIDDLFKMKFKKEIDDDTYKDAIQFKTGTVYAETNDMAKYNEIRDRIDGDIRKKDGSRYTDEELSSYVMQESGSLTQASAMELTKSIQTKGEKGKDDLQKVETNGLRAVLDQTVGAKFSIETIKGEAKGKIDEYIYKFHKQILDEDASPERIVEIANTMKANIIREYDPNFKADKDTDYNKVQLIKPFQTALNPVTGEKMMLTDDGRWVLINEGYKSGKNDSNK